MFRSVSTACSAVQVKVSVAHFGAQGSVLTQDPSIYLLQTQLLVQHVYPQFSGHQGLQLLRTSIDKQLEAPVGLSFPSTAG